MSKEELAIRIIELRKEQIKIFSSVIGHRSIAKLKALASEYALIGADRNVIHINKRIAHYSSIIHS